MTSIFSNGGICMGFGSNSCRVGEKGVKSKFNLLSILVLILFLSISVYSAAPILTDAELLDSTQAKAANYFYEQATSTGFVKDIQTTSYSSTAATGFGLAAFTIMSERYGTNSNWAYTPVQLRARTNLILNNIILIQSKQLQDPISFGTRGMLYHFINSDNTNAGSEVSTVDSALLFAGVITAGEYFGGEVKEKANTIISNVNWAFFQKTPQNNFTTKDGNANMYQFTMAWSPNGGYSTQCWDRPTDEALLISVMALATDSNNLNFQKSIFSWPRNTRTYDGFSVVNSYFGTLFSYEFAHFFIDFEKIGADTPALITPTASAVNWWQNSINAAKANRQFCINNASTYASYGPDSWGLSSVYSPNGTYFGELGALPNDNMYAHHDGTVAPYSSISTMPFFKSEDSGVLANNLGFKVLRNLYNTKYDSLWGIYGPKDSFNDKNEVSSNYLGLDQGPIVISIENYKSSLVMNQFMKNTSIKSALKKVFTCPNGVCDTAVVCSLNSQCNDNNSLTTDNCKNAGTTQSYCEYTPFVACYSNSQCSDNNISTDDLCINPGVTSSYCSFVPNGQNCVVPTNGMQLTESTTFCYGGYDTHDINLAADNITVDCAGASFTNPIGNYYRFLITGRKNITLKNCIVGKSTYGISITKSSSITLSDNTFRGAYDTAISAFNSTKLNIINNSILNNEYQNGIYFYDVNDSNIINNKMSNNGYGGSWSHKGAIALNYSNRNKILNNNLSDNYRALFVVSNSGNNYFANNRLCGNTIENLCSEGTIGNTGLGNTIPASYGSSCSWLTTSSRSCESSCDDSIDNGLNYFIKGTTTFWDGSTAGSQIDSCVNKSTLKEYSCSPGILETINTCTYGCEDGACLNNYVCSSSNDCGIIHSDTNLCIEYTNESPPKMSDWIIQESYFSSCINPGTVESSCDSGTNVIIEEKIEYCPLGCFLGACNKAQCISNTECNDNNAKTIDTCVNPGTINSSCSYAVVVCLANTECNDNNSLTVDTCVNPNTVNSYCTNIKPAIACSTITQCGTSGYLNNLSCSGNNVQDTYRTYSCVNPGTTSSRCSSVDALKIKSICKTGTLCSGGACVKPICTSAVMCNDNNAFTIDVCVNPNTLNSSCTHTAIACTTSAQCGTNEWLGQSACSGANIADYFRTFTCVNPGKVTSYCSSADALKIKSTCKTGTLCSSGACVKPVCSNNISCNDNNPYTADVCVNPGKLTSSCTNTAIMCLTNVDCDDGDPFTMDVCKNPKLITSDCTHTTIACTNNVTCDDGDPLTLDTCSNPNTTLSKCNHVAIKCASNSDCDDFNPLTSNICTNPGLKTSVCNYYPIIPTTIWSIAPNNSGTYFNAATCNVVTRSVCPTEMGWEGNKVTYAFVLPRGDLTDKLVLKFNVTYRNYGVSKDVLLRISAGSSTALTVVNPSLAIDATGLFQVMIPTSYFKQGTTNYIQLYGTNITPIGYGKNPPNFKISSIELSQNTE